METDKSAVSAPSQHPSARGLIAREAPYLAIFVLTICGIAYASTTHTALQVYWGFLAVVSCAVSIYAGWHIASGHKARIGLIWTQLLHWGAVIACMGLVFVPSVDAIEDADTTSLLVMLLLSLGTFLAGVHSRSWRMGLNGIVLALFVPAIAWLDQSALFLALGALIAVIAILGILVTLRRRK
ncbi:MAG: hypothetical protein AcusKO_44090 [Acuticoccus sp.]